MNEHLLLIEDDPLVSASTVFLLQRSGFPNVEVAATVKAAISALQSSTFDLAIVDYHVGGETSEPILKELSRDRIPYFALSGNVEGFYSKEYAAPRVIIQKPYSPKTLIQATHAALDAIQRQRMSNA